MRSSQLEIHNVGMFRPDRQTLLSGASIARRQLVSERHSDFSIPAIVLVLGSAIDSSLSSVTCSSRNLLNRAIRVASRTAFFGKR